MFHARMNSASLSWRCIWAVGKVPMRHVWTTAFWRKHGLWCARCLCSDQLRCYPRDSPAKCGINRTSLPWKVKPPEIKKGKGRYLKINLFINIMMCLFPLAQAHVLGRDSAHHQIRLLNIPQGPQLQIKETPKSPKCDFKFKLEHQPKTQIAKRHIPHWRCFWSPRRATSGRFAGLRDQAYTPSGAMVTAACFFPII